MLFWRKKHLSKADGGAAEKRELALDPMLNDIKSGKKQRELVGMLDEFFRKSAQFYELAAGLYVSDENTEFSEGRLRRLESFRTHFRNIFTPDAAPCELQMQKNASAPMRKDDQELLLSANERIIAPVMQGLDYSIDSLRPMADCSDKYADALGKLQALRDEMSPLSVSIRASTAAIKEYDRFYHSR